VVDPTTTAARRALLDVLEALTEQRDAVTLVGSQAIYLHVGEDDLAVSPFTQDADLAIDPVRLLARPGLAEALGAAGFAPGSDPGIWFTASGVQVDLLVAAAVAGPGRRGARLGPPHGDRVARKVAGIEGALVDRSVRWVTSYQPQDSRRFEVAVAGPAALWVAKVHKLAERIGDPRRAEDKDALDLFRLLRGLPTETLADGIRRLRSDGVAGETTRRALDAFAGLFADPDGRGVRQLVRSLAGLEDAAMIAASCTALANALLAILTT
jgi:hypothetical protein